MSDIPQLRYDAVRATLRQRGVTHVVVGYNGGGDSGGVETVDAFAADGSSVTLSPEHEKIFERVADNVMPNTGWWNGPGGYGTISFDLATADAHLTHYEYTDRNTTVEYEFGPEKLSKWVQEQFTGAPIEFEIYEYGLWWPDRHWARVPTGAWMEQGPGVEPRPLRPAEETFRKWLQALVRRFPPTPPSGEWTQDEYVGVQLHPDGTGRVQYHYSGQDESLEVSGWQPVAVTN
jgi:hypothetical protein